MYVILYTLGCAFPNFHCDTMTQIFTSFCDCMNIFLAFLWNLTTNMIFTQTPRTIFLINLIFTKIKKIFFFHLWAKCNFYWNIHPLVLQHHESAHEIMVLITCEQRGLRQACASAQSRHSLHCWHTWSMEVDEGPDQKSDT